MRDHSVVENLRGMSVFGSNHSLNLLNGRLYVVYDKPGMIEVLDPGNYAQKPLFGMRRSRRDSSTSLRSASMGA